MSWLSDATGINLDTGLDTSGRPNYAQPVMDSGTKNAINDQLNKGAETPQEATGQLLNGVDRSSAMTSSAPMLQQETQSLGGGGMPGMSAAIAKKQNNNFQKSLGQIKNKAAIQGQNIALSNETTAATTANSLNSMQNNIQNQVNNWNLQAQAARNSVISSVMSGAGSIAGGAMANSGSVQFSPNMSAQLGSGLAPGGLGGAPVQQNYLSNGSGSLDSGYGRGY